MYYARRAIVAELQSKPVLLNNNKFMELFAGYLVACMIKEIEGLDLMVGFPLKKITKHRKPKIGPTIQELIENPKLIDDSDFDICIGNEQMIFRCQITRIVSHGDRNRRAGNFFDVLKKKLLVQSDDGLTLIINIEDEISIDKSQLISFLSTNKIPYGAIYVVGKSCNKAGIFKYCRIYPDLSESGEFDIEAPL